MFDNPQQNVTNNSKKLRPIKLSDEAFELFYKEIYAEFGPKDVPPVELNPKKAVQEEAPAAVSAPVAEEASEEFNPFLSEPVEAETEAPAAAAEPETEEDNTIQEDAAKAAAVIRNVQEDEVINDYTDGVQLVKPKKKKGIKGLVITICLELLAIAGVVAYWLLYIL